MEMICEAEDKHEFNLMNDQEHEEVMKRQDELFEKIRGLLSGENEDLMIDLESAYSNDLAIHQHYMYRCGIQDGLELFKSIKGVGSDINQEPVDFYNKVTKLYCDYKEKVTGSRSDKETDMYDFIKKYKSDYQLEILHYIYKNAYNDGFKQGHKEALK